MTIKELIEYCNNAVHNEGVSEDSQVVIRLTRGTDCTINYAEIRKQKTSNGWNQLIIQTRGDLANKATFIPVREGYIVVMLDGTPSPSGNKIFVAKKTAIDWIRSRVPDIKFIEEY